MTGFLNWQKNEPKINRNERKMNEWKKKWTDESKKNDSYFFPKKHFRIQTTIERFISNSSRDVIRTPGLIFSVTVWENALLGVLWWVHLQENNQVVRTGREQAGGDRKRKRSNECGKRGIDGRRNTFHHSRAFCEFGLSLGRRKRKGAYLIWSEGEKKKEEMDWRITLCLRTKRFDHETRRRMHWDWTESRNNRISSISASTAILGAFGSFSGSMFTVNLLVRGEEKGGSREGGKSGERRDEREGARNKKKKAQKVKYSSGSRKWEKNAEVHLMRFFSRYLRHEGREKVRGKWIYSLCHCPFQRFQIIYLKRFRAVPRSIQINTNIRNLSELKWERTHTYHQRPSVPMSLLLRMRISMLRWLFRDGFFRQWHQPSNSAMRKSKNTMRKRSQRKNDLVKSVGVQRM